MRFTTLETTVSVPFELGGEPFPVEQAPLEVQEQVAAGRPWHLVAWVDKSGRSVGLCHKGRCTQALWPAAHVAIGSMRPAKGRGYVALETFALEGASVPLLYSPTYSEPLLSWLLAHQAELSDLLACPVEIEDWGQDY